MRGVYGVVVVLVACVLAAPAGGAHRESGAKPPGKVTTKTLTLPTPAPGSLLLGLLKTTTTAPAAIAAAKAGPPKIHLVRSAPGLDVVIAVHTARTTKRVTRTYLIVAANRGTRVLAGATPAPTKSEIALTILFTDIWFGKDTLVKYLGDNGGERFVGDLNPVPAAAPVPKAVEDPWRNIVFDKDPWTPKGNVRDAALGWFNRAYSWGWSMRNRDIAKQWVNAFDGGNLDEVIASIEADLAKDGPPPPATYSCVGEQVKIFDNWNGLTTRPGAKIDPTFGTGGKAYCLDMIATYHWNNGRGAPPGSIGLIGGGQTLGPWKAEGTDGQNGVHNANWVATPPAGTVLQGSYECTDSDHSTWATNDDAHGIGFCRVWGREAQKAG